MAGFNFSEFGPDYYAKNYQGFKKQKWIKSAKAYCTDFEDDFETMSRRLAGNVIKLEVYFGADRQTIMIRRNQDLVVRDVMEEIEKAIGIPFEEQVIFHKGNNLSEYMDTTLEQLGIENNHPIRINRDPLLPKRSPRQNRSPNNGMGHQQMISGYPQDHMMMNNQVPQVVQHSLDPKSYLKEIQPGRVPDPTPYQVQLYNQSLQNPQNFMQKSEGPQDILKLNVSFGSEREYVMIHGQRPLKLSDLKQSLAKTFKIPPEQQAIVFKGYNMHDYMDEAPLASFGLENNSQVNVWPRIMNSYPDYRLPRGPDQQPTMMIDHAYNNTPRINPGPGQQPRWPISSGRIVKIDAAHGSDHHNVMLYEIEKPLTVLDLQKELEKLTHVSCKDQRIFHKSHEISLTPYLTLAECEIENNSSVKLIGEPGIKNQNFFTTRPNGAEVGSQGAIGNQQTPRNPNQQFIDTQYRTY